MASNITDIKAANHVIDHLRLQNEELQDQLAEAKVLLEKGRKLVEEMIAELEKLKSQTR